MGMRLRAPLGARQSELRCLAVGRSLKDHLPLYEASQVFCVAIPAISRMIVRTSICPGQENMLRSRLSDLTVTHTA